MKAPIGSLSQQRKIREKKRQKDAKLLAEELRQRAEGIRPRDKLRRPGEMDWDGYFTDLFGKDGAGQYRRLYDTFEALGIPDEVKQPVLIWWGMRNITTWIKPENPPAYKPQTVELRLSTQMQEKIAKQAGSSDAEQYDWIMDLIRVELGLPPKIFGAWMGEGMLTCRMGSTPEKPKNPRLRKKRGKRKLPG